MVAHRLADPRSKRACAEWLALDAWIPGARGLTAQHLYRKPPANTVWSERVGGLKIRVGGDDGPTGAECGASAAA